MSFTLSTLWHDRQRYLPGILAVGFSSLLIALQCGLLLGLFSVTSIPIDHTKAHIWVGSPKVKSVDLGGPIPEIFVDRVANEPEVARTEPYIQSFGKWKSPKGGTELCVVIGCRLSENAIGAIHELTPDLREKLTEPGSVVIDESEFDRLGVDKVGDTAEVFGQRSGGRPIRVVGKVTGLKGIAGPYIFCSLSTAQEILGMHGQVTFLLAQCTNPADAPAVVERLKKYEEEMLAWESYDFSIQSRLHWLFKTKAGIALGYAALLGLIVGAVVTSQTLYAATIASMREYAILLALGIPRWRLVGTVLAQAFWVGVAGVIFSIPITFLLGEAANRAGAKVLLPAELIAGAAAVTMMMAVGAGLMALRSLRHIEPVNLLR
jgi:putative ABC transport system permease protein